MHAYIDALDFTGLELDEALRLCISRFRIPGEAQKIDRIMEKFAEIFCINNRGVFPSADTAYVLSYSIIMLQTNLHNPNIKPEQKMKKHQYFVQNRGIASGRDLSDDYLGGIFDRVLATPFTLKDSDEVRFSKKEGSSAPMSHAARQYVEKMI